MNVNDETDDVLAILSTKEQLWSALVRFIQERKRTVERLNDVSYELAVVDRGVRGSKVVGNSMGLTGALVGLGAVSASVATAGLALPAITAALSLSGLGFGVTVSADVTQHLCNSRGMHQLDRQVKREAEVLRDLFRTVSIAYDLIRLTQAIKALSRGMHQLDRQVKREAEVLRDLFRTVSIACKFATNCDQDGHSMSDHHNLDDLIRLTQAIKALFTEGESESSLETVAERNRKGDGSTTALSARFSSQLEFQISSEPVSDEDACNERGIGISNSSLHAAYGETCHLSLQGTSPDASERSSHCDSSDENLQTTAPLKGSRSPVGVVERARCDPSLSDLDGEIPPSALGNAISLPELEISARGTARWVGVQLGTKAIVRAIPLVNLPYHLFHVVRTSLEYQQGDLSGIAAKVKYLSDENRDRLNEWIRFFQDSFPELSNILAIDSCAIERNVSDGEFDEWRWSFLEPLLSWPNWLTESFLEGQSEEHAAVKRICCDEAGLNEDQAEITGSGQEMMQGSPTDHPKNAVVGQTPDN
eukprot:CAMPEP_0184689320 /NCGR_PEP_ID=MMETSP0312-20130426/30591_1 /TAXON_ID=31354 /ORGANISM="Compsopogon coeruleus, Strain SAG 36.94" /LENGTH=533 /DNA_ID=CAMNT_0027146657 /DNA_START=1588 /DNA_END=3189 /DNA_ORIENTATION=-